MGHGSARDIAAIAVERARASGAGGLARRAFWVAGAVGKDDAEEPKPGGPEYQGKGECDDRDVAAGGGDGGAGFAGGVGLNDGTDEGGARKDGEWRCAYPPYAGYYHNLV